jgi:hypothetical protein
MPVIDPQNNEVVETLLLGETSLAGLSDGG